jgi:hypothetical protein
VECTVLWQNADRGNVQCVKGGVVTRVLCLWGWDLLFDAISLGTIDLNTCEALLHYPLLLPAFAFNPQSHQ